MIATVLKSYYIIWIVFILLLAVSIFGLAFVQTSLNEDYVESAVRIEILHSISLEDIGYRKNLNDEEHRYLELANITSLDMNGNFEGQIINVQGVSESQLPVTVLGEVRSYAGILVEYTVPINLLVFGDIDISISKYYSADTFLSNIYQ